jgi:CRISPR-associated endoribonuclease Cas2 subtype I-E
MSHALTLVITRDVEHRYRGLLRSTMLEVAAGIYVSPQLNRDARDQLWAVLEKWHQALMRGSIVMIWRDAKSFGDVGVRILGETTRDLIEADGILLTRLKK